MELIAVVAILGVLATAAISRFSGPRDEAERQACFVQQGEIELQSWLWKRANGSFPATNLSDIGEDTNYFPEGLPTCPVDGSAYTIDASGRIVGHTHD